MFLCHLLSLSPFLSLLSFAFALFLNLPMKSTLATSNYNEQLHMTAPPAAKIRQGSSAHTHTNTHTHIPPSPPPPPPSHILSPSSQNNRLLPNSALIFYVNNTDISPPSAMRRRREAGRGERGRRRKGLSQERWRRRAQQIKSFFLPDLASDCLIHIYMCEYVGAGGL